MVEYKEFLHSLKTSELKQIIKAYLSHLKIKVTNKKKYELISDIIKHTDFKNNEIVLKEQKIKIEKTIINKMKNIFEEKEEKENKRYTKRLIPLKKEIDEGNKRYTKKMFKEDSDTEEENKKYTKRLIPVVREIDEDNKRYTKRLFKEKKLPTKQILNEAIYILDDLRKASITEQTFKKCLQYLTNPKNLSIILYNDTDKFLKDFNMYVDEKLYPQFVYKDEYKEDLDYIKKVGNLEGDINFQKLEFYEIDDIANKFISNHFKSKTEEEKPIFTFNY